MERFFCGTELVRGEGALSALERWRSSRVLLVTAEGEAVSRLPFRRARVLTVGPGMPDSRQAARGVRELRAFDPELVAALGDAGVMGWAKALVRLGKKECPLVTIPRLPASGEEVCPRVTLCHEGCAVTLEEAAPAMVVLDPALFLYPGRQVLAETGFSLLSDAMESFVSREGGTLAAILAREAFCMAWAVLPAAVLGAPEAMEKLHMASVLVGMAYSRSGLGLCRSLSSALATRFDKPVGRMKAVLLPEVLSCNACGAMSRYAALGRAAGLGGASEEGAVRNLKGGLVRLRRELGLPETLARAGILPGEARGAAGELYRMVSRDPEGRGNPVGVDDFLLRRLLERTMGRL